MGYTSERNCQIVIELLKHHGIKRIIASPGATNVSFVASVQQDPYFEIYSSVDERSAAYIACGLAAESGQPVVLSCTGATASRNYFPGLTEAYYRHLPILALTSTMPADRIGHNIPQVIDRSNLTNDIAKMSVYIPTVKDSEDEWNCNIKANEAILELTHGNPGPVHINLETLQSGTFDIKSIQPVQAVDRIIKNDSFPEISNKNIAIFIGAHSKWTEKSTELVDSFCEKYNAVVIGDHTNNYRGKYSVPASLICNQKNNKFDCMNIDLLIHLGDISGAYLNIHPREVWRVNQDGKLCDTFRKLRFVFEMDEYDFFEQMHSMKNEVCKTSYYESWKAAYEDIFNRIPDLPFSNLWIAKQLSKKLPENSVLHLGILNSLRSWNFFEIPNSVMAYSNTGGFGIDGCISTVLGASLASPNKLFFGIMGDLAFFYDMNCLGNRHFSNNIRLMLINNGHGQEFTNHGHRAAQFGDDTDKYIAAAGHYGNKSDSLVKDYVQNLGFTYLTANDKQTFLDNINEFVSDEHYNKPIVFEVFTNNEDESNALKLITNVNNGASDNAKNFIKGVIGENGVKKIKNFLKG